MNQVTHPAYADKLPPVLPSKEIELTAFVLMLANQEPADFTNEDARRAFDAGRFEQTTIEARKLCERHGIQWEPST